MSKAKERALEKYPFMSDDDKEGLEALKYIGMECECAAVFNEAQEAKQSYFIEGYHQAEKDLELTCEDIRELYIIFADVDVEIELCKADNIKSETIGYFQEVLKRFKDFKERKEKMTSNDIKSVQIIATTKDGKHIMAVSDEKPLIWHIVSCCKFAKLKDELFEQCSLKEIME